MSPSACFLDLDFAHRYQAFCKRGRKTMRHVLYNQYGKVYVPGELRQKHLKRQRATRGSTYRHNIHKSPALS